MAAVDCNPVPTAQLTLVIVREGFTRKWVNNLIRVQSKLRAGAVNSVSSLKFFSDIRISSFHVCNDREGVCSLNRQQDQVCPDLVP